MKLFQRTANPHALTLGMTAIKMGDRFLQIGCAHGGRLAALAGKVGLSGRACVATDRESDAARAQKAAADAGLLIEVDVAPLDHLPYEDEGFDLIVIDDTGELMAAHDDAQRDGLLRETMRLLRPGGRLFALESTGATGLAGLLHRAPSDSPYRRDGGALTLLQRAGYRSARKLAEREGLAFIEGMKPRRS
jgi:ubiquinone/menaquinone biosynthesis C-methylase UbiE